MDYKALNSRVSALLTSLGFVITVKRNGTTLGKASAVVTPSKTDLDEGATSTSLIQLTRKTMYVSAPSGFAPQVGDLVTAKTEKWQITAIEEVKPSEQMVCFVFEVQ